MKTAKTASSHRGWLRRLPGLLLWLAMAAGTAWAFGALRFDFPVRGSWVAWLYLVGVLALGVCLHGPARKLGATALAFTFVLSWWLTQTPRQDRDWQPDVVELPWAEIDGDEVTLHHVRNFDYRTATEFVPRWETRKVRLSQLTGVDMFINYWGSPWMAHPIVSFQFADSAPLCFSIETRKEVGEAYSALGGLYRQFELYCVVADERDVIGLRTRIRPGEQSFLYHMLLSPESARERLLEYLASINDLRVRPRWYNAVTTNCTTAIRGQHPAGSRIPWDWRILVNGKADEMLHERGYVATGGMTFPELRQRALINPAAQAAGTAPDFSRRIRAGRPGFAEPAR